MLICKLCQRTLTFICRFTIVFTTQPKFEYKCLSDKIYSVFCWYRDWLGPVWSACATRPISMRLKQCKQRLLFNHSTLRGFCWSHVCPFCMGGRLSGLRSWFVNSAITPESCLSGQTLPLWNGNLKICSRHSYLMERRIHLHLKELFWFQGCKQCVCEYVCMWGQRCVSPGWVKAWKCQVHPWPTLNTSP